MPPLAKKKTLICRSKHLRLLLALCMGWQALIMITRQQDIHEENIRRLPSGEVILPGAFFHPVAEVNQSLRLLALALRDFVSSWDSTETGNSGF